MEISSLISPDRIVTDLRAATKDAALRALARLAAAQLQLDEATIQQALLNRERLGSTGIGQGVAIPHARIAGLERVFCLFARSEKPVEFEAVDARPVDLFCLLLTPAGEHGEHLAALACVSRRLRDPETARRLRAAKTPGKDARPLYDILLGGSAP